MKSLYLAAALLATGLSSPVSADLLTPQLLVDLPNTFNSPASSDIDSQGNVFITSPNFHNDTLIKAGEMQTPAVPRIGMLDKNNNFTNWYTFKPQDMAPTTGKIAPMGIAFGPDGNAYVADMQMWFDGSYKSRILRINVVNGKAISVDEVATGLLFPNAVVFKGDDLFISETVLKLKNNKQLSGVYKININELNAKQPAQFKPYLSESDHDPRLFDVFTSNASLKFGANGLTFDGEGNLYTSIMEDGSVIKTTMNAQNEKISSAVFATGLVATDGLKWDKRTNKIYITDLFANAIYSIDMQGKLALLAQNGNTTGLHGELDAPSELIVRGKDIIIMNFDAVFDSPKMVNKQADNPHTLSVIKLK
ncbi:hypothetical protein ACOBV8_12215 [Pseudoalteromonas espejiana]